MSLLRIGGWFLLNSRIVCGRSLEWYILLLADIEVGSHPAAAALVVKTLTPTARILVYLSSAQLDVTYRPQENVGKH